MVLVAFERRVVSSEALAVKVVVVRDGPSRPPVALYSEMIVAQGGQTALPRPTLKYPLRQCYAGWNAITEHLTDGQVLISVKIILIGLIPFDSGRRNGATQKQNGSKEQEEKSFHYARGISVFFCKNT